MKIKLLQLKGVLISAISVYLSIVLRQDIHRYEYMCFSDLNSNASNIFNMVLTNRSGVIVHLAETFLLYDERVFFLQ